MFLLGIGQWLFRSKKINHIFFVPASTKFQLTLTPPDFAHLPVEDLFKQLGPVAIFSAKHHWTAPRSIQLQRANNSDTGFGFSVRGDAPVIVASVDSGSLAQVSSLDLWLPVGYLLFRPPTARFCLAPVVLTTEIIDP